MDRFQRTAARIQAAHGVRVEWAPANREYVVDNTPCSSAREAESTAYRIAKELAARCGAGNSYRRR